MQRIRFLFAVTLIFAGNAAQSDVINLTVHVGPVQDPFDDQNLFLLTEYVDQSGVVGNFWRGDLSLPEFSLSAGDKLNLNVLFTDRYLLEIADETGTFGPIISVPGTESFFFALFEEKPGEPSFNPLATFDWEMRWRAARGDLNVNPATGGRVNDPIQDSLIVNYTDSSFAFRGFNLMLDMHWTSTGDPYAVNRLRIDLLAERIRVVRVPEPSTLALLGIGLFGMCLARRRQENER